MRPSRSLLRPVASLTAVAALAGIALATAPGAPGGTRGDAGSGSGAAGASAAREPVLALTHVFDERGGVAIEGSRTFVRLTSDSTISFRSEFATPDFSIRYALGAPGRFRLTSYQRTCSGNCGHLDPPSHRCSRAFAARAGERVHVRVVLRFDRDACSVRITKR